MLKSILHILNSFLRLDLAKILEVSKSQFQSNILLVKIVAGDAGVIEDWKEWNLKPENDTDIFYLLIYSF